MKTVCRNVLPVGTEHTNKGRRDKRLAKVLWCYQAGSDGAPTVVPVQPEVGKETRKHSSRNYGKERGKGKG